MINLKMLIIHKPISNQNNHSIIAGTTNIPSQVNKENSGVIKNISEPKSAVNSATQSNLNKHNSEPVSNLEKNQEPTKPTKLQIKNSNSQKEPHKQELKQGISFDVKIIQTAQGTNTLNKNNTELITPVKVEKKSNLKTNNSELKSSSSSTSTSPIQSEQNVKVGTNLQEKGSSNLLNNNSTSVKNVDSVKTETVDLNKKTDENIPKSKPTFLSNKNPNVLITAPSNKEASQERPKLSNSLTNGTYVNKSEDVIDLPQVFKHESVYINNGIVNVDTTLIIGKRC